MATLRILHTPDPNLRIISRPLTADKLLHASTQERIDALIETMRIEEGVGIAAPQAGFHERMIIVETPHGPEAFVNPVLTARSVRMVASVEGCLSVPGLEGTVKRHSSVKVQAMNRKGEELTIKANGLLAIIFQHEIDHLDGILFIDKATNVREYRSSRL